MIDGAFLIIEHVGTGRFVQLYKDRGDGSSVILIFDLPKVDANVEGFERTVVELSSVHPELERVTEQSGTEGSLECAQIRLEGNPFHVADCAFDLVRLTLAGLHAEGGGYIMTLHGQRDVRARALASRDDLKRLAAMRLPVVSRMAKRTLRKISEE
jgi:hypothetical protein